VMPWSKDAQESRSPAEQTGGRTLSRRSHSPGSPTDPHLLHYEREIISLDDRGPLSRRKLGKDIQNFMLQLRKLDLRSTEAARSSKASMSFVSRSSDVSFLVPRTALSEALMTLRMREGSKGYASSNWWMR